MCIHSNRRELNRVTNRAYIMSEFYKGQPVKMTSTGEVLTITNIEQNDLGGIVVLSNGSSAWIDQVEAIPARLIREIPAHELTTLDKQILKMMEK